MTLVYGKNVAKTATEEITTISAEEAIRLQIKALEAQAAEHERELLARQAEAKKKRDLLAKELARKQRELIARQQQEKVACDRLELKKVSPSSNSLEPVS